MVKNPITNAPNVFIDTDKSGNIAIVFQSILHTNTTQIHYPTSSVQQTELKTCQYALQLYPFAINLFTNSQYVARAVPQLEHSFILTADEKLYHLFTDIKRMLFSRTDPIFITHIRAHSGLPGPLTAGNNLANKLTHVNFLSSIETAKHSHNHFHQNASAFKREFKITRTQTRQIVKRCLHSPVFHNPPSYSVNPHGLLPNTLWQMDVTQYKPFSKLSYIHMSVDTCSGFIFASAHSGEVFLNVQNHLFQTFAVLGRPKSLKTDNGSTYTSTAFNKFYSSFNIQHITGIPYNSTGQAIVERSHASLKNSLQKTKKGDILTGRFKYPPHVHLSIALYVLNFLNVDLTGRTAAERFWHPDSFPFLWAKWRDPLTRSWWGPNPVLRRGRGYVCLFPQDEKTPRCVPDRWV